jgi:hypothetical protein
MFVEQVALDVVPEYARISLRVVDAVVSRFLQDPARFERSLDHGFHAMQARQPALAEYMAGEISQLPAARVQGLAYFLCVLVYRSFEEAFGARLARVELDDINGMLARLIADSELRAQWASGVTYSEDAIAVGQPALVNVLREEVDRAASDEPEIAWEAIDPFYESLLVVVLALTHAVAP